MTGRADSPMSEPTCGLWSTRITRGVTPSAPDSIAGSSVAISMPVRPAPTTTAVALAGSCGRGGQIADVRLQPHRAVVGVDVVPELGKPRKIRLGHAAAHRQYEAVVAKGGAVGRAHRRSGRVDSGDVGGDVADADRIEQVLQRDSARR